MARGIKAGLLLGLIDHMRTQPCHRTLPVCGCLPAAEDHLRGTEPGKTCLEAGLDVPVICIPCVTRRGYETLAAECRADPEREIPLPK